MPKERKLKGDCAIKLELQRATFSMWDMNPTSNKGKVRNLLGKGEETPLRIYNHEPALTKVYRPNSWHLCWEKLLVENLIYSRPRLVCPQFTDKSKYPSPLEEFIFNPGPEKFTKLEAP